MKAFEDAFNLMCGPQIGEGIHRKVFLCKINPSWVVKVETDEDHRTFANAYEHRNWTDNQHYKPVAQWLAPVEWISPNGLILLQRRTSNARPEDLPPKLPRFLTDIKWENFGWLDGRLVCIDYSTLITTIPTHLRKVEW